MIISLFSIVFLIFKGIYYKVDVLEYDDDHNNWIKQFTEIEWCDFYLYDPNYLFNRLYVPARHNRMIGKLLFIFLFIY